MFDPTTWIRLLVKFCILFYGDEVQTYLPPEPAVQIRVVTRADVAAAREAKQRVLDYLYGEDAATVARFNRLNPRFVWAGRKLRVPTLPEGTVSYSPLPTIYPPAQAEPRFILIALNDQFLGVYEYGLRVASYPISSGKYGFRTPTGDFRVGHKIVKNFSRKYPEPNGGAPMPWSLAFRGTAYWIHGGDLPGYPASHGCVRMFAADAQVLFGWATIGTPVKIVKSLK